MITLTPIDSKQQSNKFLATSVTKKFDHYNGTLYGRTGADTDEFIFMGDGYVDVLLSGYGSTHYQSYMREGHILAVAVCLIEATVKAAFCIL